jgi:DNA-binding ferritin-like protein (Dps family)
MSKFFDDYFNISKIKKSKREYKQQMQRVKALPEDYQYVFKKIQNHMWQFAAGSGYDMMEVHYGLIDLFEEGAANGKSVLEVTGEDVAAFVDELLKNARTYTEDWRTKLNHEIKNKIGGGKNGKK